MNYRKVLDKKTQNEDFKTLLNNTDQRFKTLLNKIDLSLNEVVQELKTGCVTYEDVFNKLNLLEKETIYKSQYGKEFIACFLINIREQIKKEMNDLPVTNRSE